MVIGRHRAASAAAATAAVLLAGCNGGAGVVSAPTSPAATSPSPTASPPAPPSPSPSPSPSLSPTPDAPSCSAGDAPPIAPQDLPPAVATTRAAIAAAARACDYAALEDLARAGTRPFTYSFGGDDEPARFWREQEAHGEQPLRTLVEVLRRGHVERTEEKQHVWPAAFGYDDWASVPTAAREELAGLYGPEDLARFEQFGAYVGYRVGIKPDGEWLFFVAGD